MAPLLENDLKKFLRHTGMLTPAGITIREPIGDQDLRPGLEFPVMAKALVPIGKKAKFGGVHKCESVDEMNTAVRGLLGSEIRGFPCDSVLVESLIDISQELYVSFMFDSISRGPVALLSASGGVDIETVAAEQQDAITRIPISIDVGLTLEVATEGWLGLGISADCVSAVATATVQAWDAFRLYDATLLEINPLAVDAAGRAVVVGAIMDIDDEALFRQPQFSDLIQYGSGRFGRPLTSLERELLDLNERERKGSIRYMDLPGGDLANLVFGGGCSLLATDQIYDAGGSPCTYYDATAPSDTLLRQLFRGVLQKPGLRGMIFGANIINLFPVAQRLQILVEVVKELGIDAKEVPIVVRLAGSGDEDARLIADTLPGLEFFADEITIEQAIDRFLERVGVSEKDVG